MSWSTPKTWVTGEALTASDLNTGVRDNLNALKNPPSDEYTLNEVSDYTTTSTTFVDVDGTNLSLTITTAGGDVIVCFSGSIQVGGTADSVFLDFTVDGTRHFGDDGHVQSHEDTTSQSWQVCTFVALVTGLSAGSHTFELQWKAQSSGTLTMPAGAGSANKDTHPQFWVREVS